MSSSTKAKKCRVLGPWLQPYCVPYLLRQTALIKFTENFATSSFKVVFPKSKSNRAKTKAAGLVRQWRISRPASRSFNRACTKRRRITPAINLDKGAFPIEGRAKWKGGGGGKAPSFPTHVFVRSLAFLPFCSRFRLFRSLLQFRSKRFFTYV